MTIDKLSQAFLGYEVFVKRIRPTSCKTYSSMLGKFVKFCGPGASVEAATDKLQQYLLLRGSQLGDHAFAKTFQVLRCLLKFGSQRHGFTNPLEGRPAPMVHPKEKTFLSEEQVRQLLTSTAASGRLHSKRDAAILAVLYFGLLRVGEAIRLRLQDIDLDAGEILVMGKGGIQRRVPLCESLNFFLRQYIGQVPQGSPVLFPARAAHHTRLGILDNCRIEKALRDVYAPASGLAGKVTPHTLRRSAADRLRKRGIGLAVIQGLLGHRRIETTMAYLGVSGEELRDAIMALDGPPLIRRVGDHGMIKGLSHETAARVKRNFFAGGAR